MAEATAEATAETTKKPISPQEAATGMGYDREIEKLSAQLDQAIKARDMFVAHLRITHGADEEHYGLTDWVAGFYPAEPVEQPKAAPKRTKE